MSHANRRAFSGVLTILDKPSDKAPVGARGHRVLLTKEAADNALAGIIGMAVDYKVSWNGHDARMKIGIITDASIRDGVVAVSGFIYARDFSDLIFDLETKDNLGMSYELADCHVDDMTSDIWTISRVTFTGAAILLRDKAAYKDTSFQLLKGSGLNPLHLAACTDTRLDMHGIAA